MIAKIGARCRLPRDSSITAITEKRGLAARSDVVLELVEATEREWR